MSTATVSAPDSHLDLLERPLFAHFATVRADGAPQVNPMWFVWEGDEGVIKLTHTNQRSNFRYIKKEPRVAFSIVDPDDGYRYLQVRGVIEKIEDDPTGAMYRRLHQRYHGTDTEVRDKDVRVVLTVRPTAFKAR